MTEHEILQRVKKRFIDLSNEYEILKQNLRIKIVITNNKLEYAVMNQRQIINNEIKLSEILDLNFVENIFQSVIKGYIWDNMKRLIQQTGSAQTDARIFARNENCDLAVALFVNDTYNKTITIQEIINDNKQ